MLDKFIEEKIVVIFTSVTAFISLFIAMISLSFTQNNSHSNNYSNSGMQIFWFGTTFLCLVTNYS
ncbi:hypothetical protein J2Z52_001833 [Enterococcus rivorum]|uniref:Uncharacterized protein n=1 Tax=Enterococcus rivorum TaxID=762845 RepID=A0A1E5KVS2_9ENTE|nr:hypothetical protein [Enterococcus rivorum]OEH81965.1 hypothetical protein BCR26_15080 [Enterococcus rivorum]